MLIIALRRCNQKMIKIERTWRGWKGLLICMEELKNYELVNHSQQIWGERRLEIEPLSTPFDISSGL